MTPHDPSPRQFFGWLVREDLDRMEALSHEVQRALEQRATDFTDSQEGAQLDAETYYAWHQYHESELLETYPRIIRNGLFVSIYSYVENALLNICRHLEPTRPADVGLCDLRHDGVRLAQTYLKKVQHIDFPDTSAEWQRLLEYNRIRNLIVHSSGRLLGSRHEPRIRAFIAQHADLVQLDGDFVVLTVLGCVDCARTSKALLVNVIERAPDWNEFGAPGYAG